MFFFEEKTRQILLSGKPHMLQILCSSVRVKLLCTLRNLKNLIRSWKSPGILHGSMNPEYTPSKMPI